MTRNDDERIADILEAGATLAAVVAGGETLWHDDEIRRLAAERLLEIIGESARAMSDEARARYAEVAWSDIIGLRTILAHHYHRVDPAQVWGHRQRTRPAPRRRTSRPRTRPHMRSSQIRIGGRKGGPT